ncbi:MAG: carboxypeptidase M32 [Phycisphaerae bacterium]|nr:carboxypeptidase M32 [Phycisphaerae bacterium]
MATGESVGAGRPGGAYAELCGLARRWGTLKAVHDLVSWDQETYMPPGAAASRSEQVAMLSEMLHEQRTGGRVGELIAACESDPDIAGTPDSDVGANVREFRRDFDRATRIPTALVGELAKTASLAAEAWKQARSASDFSSFAPWLEKMMRLSRDKAACLLPCTPAAKEPYDALLDEYEPGMTGAGIDAIFTPLRPRLSGLIAELARSPRKPDTAILGATIPAERQHSFGHTVLGAIGFDLHAGRLDTTTHPFCSGFGPGDTRLTTRYREERFTDALYGTMHEAGHGMYEQGLPKAAHLGQPAADAISLGIHESQSRMWENFVGRSREFWVWALPLARAVFRPALEHADVEGMYRAVNTASPSLIRVEADEATYNLHVMIRFQIERALIAGSLPVRDVPATWNRLYKDYLGVDVPDDRRGCLQDVHWSFGLVGYFPTYTLGNLYAAQFWETINRSLPDLRAQMSRGEFGPLRAWLNTNIHAHGRRDRADELCRRLTGRPLSADPLMRHLEGKLRPIYGV